MRAKLVVLGALGLGLLATAAAGLVVRDTDCCAQRAEKPSPAWVTHLETLERAIEARDASASVRAWRDAWSAALASRRWEALITAGDRALAVGELTQSVAAARIDARQAYHSALFRAYGERSADGVLRAAEAMSLMGDHELADGALKLARRLAAATSDPQRRAQIERDIARLAGGSTPSASTAAWADVTAVPTPY